MGRALIEVPTPALALRRAEAAASLGISVETFDSQVRPFVAAKRIGGVVVYPVASLTHFLSTATSIAADLSGRP